MSFYLFSEKLSGNIAVKNKFSTKNVSIAVMTLLGKCTLHQSFIGPNTFTQARLYRRS